MDTRNLYRTDHLADSAALATDTGSMEAVSWQNLFSDTLLKKYIRAALDSNIDIRIALENINAAAAFVRQGEAAFYPSVNAGLHYSHSKNSKNTPSGQLQEGSADQYQLGADLSWEADIWGKIRSARRAYTDSYLQTIEAHKAVKTRLIADVASAYYRLASLTAQIDITQRSIASRDSSLAITKSLKESGQLTAVAVKQTEAQLYDAQLILLDLKQQERIWENTFCLLLNEAPHPVEREGLTGQEITTPLRTGVAAGLLANRPDVRQAEYELMEAFELTNVAKSNFYPALTITAGGGLQSIEISNWLSAGSIFANIAGDLLQPVFNRRQIRTAYEVARIRQQQALLSYRRVLLTAGNDVSNALYDYQKQTAAMAVEEQQYEAYRTAVDYSEQLLVNGLANYLEVLTARQNALATQLDLANTRYARLNAIVTLYQALGGGWR